MAQIVGSAAADRLWGEFKSLTAISKEPSDTLARIGKLSKAKAQVLKASFGLAAALVQDQLPEPYCIRTHHDTVHLLREHFRLLNKEELHVLCLTGKNNLIRDVIVEPGTATSPGIQPIKVFKPAIALGAAAIILVHNHPDSDAEPSPADMSFTEDIRRAGSHLNIRLLDHVIFGAPTQGKHRPEIFSFQETGVLRY